MHSTTVPRLHSNGSSRRTKKRKPHGKLLAEDSTLSILEAALIAHDSAAPKKGGVRARITSRRRKTGVASP